MELKLSQSSLPTAIFNSSSLFPKHFALFTQRWKLDIQRITWKGHLMSKKILVHVVKEGETLSSISELYGVPILNIAASNEEIADVNLVFKGQSLKIPAVAECSHLFHFKQYLLPYRNSRLGLDIKRWNQIFTIPFHRLPLAKNTGSLPVLVALVAFCIGCIMGAFQIALAKRSRHKAANKTTKTARWRTALSDLRDPDSLNAESAHHLNQLPDDKEQLHVEDASHDFNKLEGDYQKFLSECGMSSYGYWRGGSPNSDS